MIMITFSNDYLGQQCTAACRHKAYLPMFILLLMCAVPVFGQIVSNCIVYCIDVVEL